MESLVLVEVHELYDYAIVTNVEVAPEVGEAVNLMEHGGYFLGDERLPKPIVVALSEELDLVPSWLVLLPHLVAEGVVGESLN
jgi:hypothetical protein